jgi:hemerythrin
MLHHSSINLKRISRTGDADRMLVWTDDLLTGYKTIDDQHKELFKKVNALLEAMGQGKGKEQVAEVLGFLSDYVVSHFGTEEQLMQSRKYPGFLSHRLEHTAYTDKLKRLRERFEKEGPSSLMAIESQQLLTGWWASHIGRTDKALGAFLRS